MSRAIAHRGPDGDGLWEDPGRICLAHRRLAIIDLSTGGQPMHAAELGGATIIFNGEIYNYLELRHELQQLGVRFRTQSDTEVLLELYARQGESCVRRLRGMFAFAIWDPARQQLVLARDRIGKKPLYYALHDGCLYFASTFGAVRDILPGSIVPDPEMVTTFLNLAYIPAPRTIDSRIAKLQAGTVLVVRGGDLAVTEYWNPGEPVEPFDGSWDDAVDCLDELLQTAVAIRLRSDVPLGVFLSGGVDSSLVAAIARRMSTTRILTFSVGLDVPGFDESPYAESVARRIGSEHRTFRLQCDGVDLLPSLVTSYGEPFGDQSAIPTWLLAQEARQHVTVAVGGDGGDEAFGGYDWYRAGLKLRTMRRAVPAELAAATAGLLERARIDGGPIRRLQKALSLIKLDEPDSYAAMRSLMDRAEAERLYAGALAEAWGAGRENGSRLFATIFRSTSGSILRRMRVTDVRTYLADCLMPKVDVATMAHGLEARAPLLDHEVLRFALSLPDEWISSATTGKRILRAVLERYLPSSLFDRPKRGFDLPLDVWFAGQLRPLLERLVSSEPLRATGWFQPSGLRAMIDEHVSRTRDHSERIFNLLILDEWLRQAFHGAGEPARVIPARGASCANT
jgi:asparagine synthase (glutamine-hydrolysing)